MKFLKAQTTNNRGIDRGVGIFYNTDQTVDIRSKSALKVPVGADADRPAYPALGQMRFNTTNNSVEFYDNGVFLHVHIVESDNTLKHFTFMTRPPCNLNALTLNNMFYFH